ncbi:MAG: pyridoxal phosphate-dependent aminotransferase [Rubinisphaera brasiliensis]|uniref:Aminotransferase n=1 Tax=Rubinisphaera brasiliensis (strain ATCC 49424 / DSM 5305 / JCM 21570 / IAM 15109 / NBRC 103401 / IFAM 1448) TaxID=756272 RepID=F0SFS6_RUBBR|nr:pyridoxal phosphate-dependent aminotransferase [Rubinisphaera brasiliensis]ADY61533.1 L-aspartate aminotransferase apoenzyme [Rubinisphaera brasiliensis DSM 5305]
MKFSPAVSSLQPSATIAAATKAKELKAQGKTIYEFTLGEPDFNTPLHIREAAIEAMNSGKTHYTPAGGVPDLLKAICQAAKRDYNLDIEPQNVVVSNGAKHSIHNVLTALCSPGDEVLIPTPYWVSYSALVELAGGVPVLVEASEEDGFLPSVDALRAAVTDRTRLIMINSPSNPTGVVLPVELLREIGELAVEKDLYVLSDEIYDKLLYPGATTQCFMTLSEEIAKRTIIINGVSKAYAMTGWRIGWTIGDPALIKAINKLQSQQTSNPCSISQYAAIAALTGPQECVGEMLQEFEKRRQYVVGRIKDLPNVSFVEPGGAFYVFFNVSKHFGRELPGGVTVKDSTEFCTALLEQAQVALVTGDAFGAPGFVRLSFATDMKTLEAGLDRLSEFLKN